MRIGIDIRAIGCQRTGDETYTLQLIKSLAKIDIKNSYFLYTDVYSSKDLATIKKLLSIENDNFVVVSVKPVNKLFWTFYSLSRQAKRDDLDVLHVQYIVPFFLSKKVKLITTIHDISFARYPEFISKKDLILLKLFIKLSLKRADKIIAVSKFTKDEIIDVYGIKQAKIAVIYNGGVAQEFKQIIPENKVLKFRSKYGIIKPYLLFLGTLQPRKNIPFLIKAFVKLKVDYKDNDKVKNLSLVIRGKRNGHNYDNKIDDVLVNLKKEYLNIYKQIKFIGYISNEELPFIFKGAEALCFSSVYEGFGLPLLEAMAVGSPVIASNDSCFPEIINKAGVVYEAGNYNDWTKKVNDFLRDDNLQRKLIVKGIKRASLFSWNKNAKQTIELYIKIKNKK